MDTESSVFDINKLARLYDPKPKDLKNETRFLRGLLRKKVLFSCTPEARHIKYGVNYLLERLVQSTLLPSFIRNPRIVKVGSMAEDTSIIRPDEFDFILATEIDGIEIERNCKAGRGYAHVRMTDQIKYQRIFLRWLKDDHIKGSFTRSSATGQLLWNALENFKNKIASKTSEEPLADDEGPMFESLQNALMFSVSKTLCKLNEDFVYEGDYGNMKIKQIVKMHGPAFKLEFLWKSKKGNTMTIDVDITLGIETRLLKDTLDSKEVFHHRFLDKLNENGKYMLIACHHSEHCKSGLCHRLTFTETEVELVRDLSTFHKNCYKLMKYVFNSGEGYQYISSYTFKTLILRHDCHCKEDYCLASCFRSVVADLLHYLFNKRDAEPNDPAVVLRMFIPGKKFKLHIPSIFIREHNFLDSKDYPFPCEQFLMQIEAMLSPLTSIGTRRDEAKSDDLVIVNSHFNGYRSYISTLPIINNLFDNSNCVQCYFEHYKHGDFLETVKDVLTLRTALLSSNFQSPWGFLLVRFLKSFFPNNYSSKALKRK